MSKLTWWNVAAVGCGVVAVGAVGIAQVAPWDAGRMQAKEKVVPGADEDWSLGRFLPERREGQLVYEDRIVALVDAERLKGFHELVSSEPHLAGSAGDLRNIERIASAMRGFGLDVEVQWIDVLLARPVSAELEIVSPGKLSLTVDEPAVDGDGFMDQHELTLGWNGYSGSGDVTGEVVYANRGTMQDFEKLDELGIDVAGKIVIARYGGNYRGHKAEFAEARGAAGLVIYSDPRDVGYMKGLAYPEGAWATADYIQRGCISTVHYEGDPLTPGVAAVADTEIERLDMHEVGLPTIPVQPVSWNTAREILSRMQGDPVPGEHWQGGLPFVYRVTGGEEMTLRLRVEQEWKVMRTANVVGTLTGERYPEQMVILGCHHDAWGHGASDPNAGQMVLLECARVFGELATGDEAVRPLRTIKFAAWGAEEFGIIGSTEWCEAHQPELSKHAMAYINLDMAAMGSNFRASCDPMLAQVIFDSSKRVAHCEEEDATVYESWVARSGRRATEPSVGTLGGGSDHVAFYCNLGIPSAGLGAGGARGTAYHSNADTLAWYRKAVGETYEPAAMVARVTSIVASRLAGADVVPMDVTRIGKELKAHFIAALAGLDGHIDGYPTSAFEATADLYKVRGEAIEALVAEAMAAGEEAEPARNLYSRMIGKVGRLWVAKPGPEGIEWFRNAYAISDPHSGYASWGAPVLRMAVEKTIETGDKTTIHIEHALNRYADSAKRLRLLVQYTDRFAREYLPEKERGEQIGE